VHFSLVNGQIFVYDKTVTMKDLTLLSGEAVVLPARACLDDPNPWPQAEDPSLKPWRQEPRLPDIGPALASWRGTYEEVE